MMDDKNVSSSRKKEKENLERCERFFMVPRRLSVSITGIYKLQIHTATDNPKIFRSWDDISTPLRTSWLTLGEQRVDALN